MSDPTSKPTPYAELADVLSNLPLLCRERRRQRGLSVRAAAVEIGINFATVSRFENGEDVTESTLAAVLRWLGRQEKSNG